MLFIGNSKGILGLYVHENQATKFGADTSICHRARIVFIMDCNVSGIIVTNRR